MTQIWRGRGPHGSGASRPDARLEHVVRDLQSRVDHLEAELEGLQDAVYRQALAQGEQITELRTRTEPSQIARDLSEEARKRGVE